MRYQKRISGPLLGYIDIHVEMPRVDYEKLADKRNTENSTTIRTPAQAARERQLQRFAGTKLTYKTAAFGERAAPEGHHAATAPLLANVAYYRVPKLAGTIAEAIQYRPRLDI